MIPAQQIEAFIAKWAASGAAERANAQSFLTDLCVLLGVAPPDPKTPNESENAYVFEKTIPGAKGNKNFIDCYKRGFFVLEAKQGADLPAGKEVFSAQGKDQQAKAKTGHGRRGTKGWDTAMEKARKQAENYARRLPKEEIEAGRPPFIIVSDVGHSIAVYSDWSQAGGHYVPFPDPASYRIRLEDLKEEEVQQQLIAIWTDPASLDPSRRSAKVTKQIADRLATLARSLEGKHDPEAVASFLMRCLFTMFAEDVELIPERSFTELLEELKREPENFAPMLESLWSNMDLGGFSPIIRKKLPRFNGGLFANQKAIALNEDQIQLLVEAAKSDWRDVEPAIFGTLLERALNPKERHKLGAHYTPRAYVERLVQPAVIEPLRAEWESIQVAALQYSEEGKPEKAIKEVEDFLKRLAKLRILDPACGSGNFLYVTLELLKRLEGEVLNTLADLGQGQQRLELADVMVTPANMLGIELNPRAAKIAELVLWIGFLQWHLRTRGDLKGLAEPIIRDLHNVECRDAVLEWDDRTPMLDKDGNPVTRWDGRTTLTHPVTGEQVPDPEARVQAYQYHNPRKAIWPQADFIVGNPPFIGTARMRDALGDGYTEALRKTYKNVPDSADLVMFWWDKAAELTRQQPTERFGFITTNSLRQTFNRRVLEHHMGQKDPISLAFAIPDHPWVDSVDGAAVRISMTVGGYKERTGVLQKVVEERWEDGNEASIVNFESRHGLILPDLTIGANVTSTISLESNSKITNRGVQLIGSGFIIEEEKAIQLGLDRVEGINQYIRQYRNGKDLTAKPRGVYVIDLFGLTAEEVKERFPEVYQHVYEQVKPERDQNRRKSYREKWWIHGEPRKSFRPALQGLSRYISTVETSKHRFFVFLDKEILPDNKLINIALDDAFFLGVLSSNIHVAWALASGSMLGPTPVYVKTNSFEAFPFPVPTEPQKQKISQLAEQLDAHRKRQQALHPTLTLTNLYNVLEKEKQGEALTAKDKTIHEQGLVSILRQLHEELDAAVAEAYGWPADLEEGEILERLVALNTERAAEEAQGLIRWLRPEYQAPDQAQQGVQGTLVEVAAKTVPAARIEKQVWPESLAAQAATLRDLLQQLEAPADLRTIADAFDGRKTQKRLDQIQRILETLVALGQAEEIGGKWKG